MPLVVEDDEYLQDELSTSSESSVAGEYSDDDYIKDDVYIEDDETEENSEEEYSHETEEDVWEESAGRRTSKRRKTTRKDPSTHSKAKKTRKSKREEYEGVTDSSDSDEISNGDDDDYSKERREPIDIIPFFGEEKGWDIEGIVDFRDSSNFCLVKYLHRSYREAAWLPINTVIAQGQSIARKLQNAEEKYSQLTEDDREELRESMMSYSEAERIISLTTQTGQKWYLVKWTGLSYSQCTWELEEGLCGEHQDLIDAFLTREMQRHPQSSRRKPKDFSKITGNEYFLAGLDGLQLREYQLEGVNWLCYAWWSGRNVILADEMGLGKTIQSSVYLSALRSKYGFVGSALIVVPLSTVTAWQRELSRWAPQLNTVCYCGDAASRRVIRKYELFDSSGELSVDVLLSTYELILKDRELLQGLPWGMLIVDEGHRLKNRESLLFDALNEITPNLAHRVLITGTPLQNSLRELWSLLHFLDQSNFPSYDGFSREFAPPVDMEESPEEAEDRTNRLHSTLKPRLLRRLKRDVESSLPAKREQILRVELSAEQRELYRLVLAKNYMELQRHHTGRPCSSLVNILSELKKICNHPVVFTGDQTPEAKDQLDTFIRSSGKLALLDMLLNRLLPDGHRALIFSQSVRMLDALATYLNLRGWSFQRLDGSFSSSDRKKAIDSFNSPSSPDLVFLLSTRAGGLGINLETADTVIIYDADWNPQNDAQAMARAHRIGQRRAVNVYRLVCQGSIEETILERAKQKMVLDHVVIQRMHSNDAERGRNVPDPNDLQAILKFGAKSLFDTGSHPPSSIDLDAILRRSSAEQSFNVNEEQNADFLGQFRVADIGWEQIIPAEERANAEAMAREAEMLAKEGPLQEAILVSTQQRRARTISTPKTATIKSSPVKSAQAEELKEDVLEAAKYGKISEKLSIYIKEMNDSVEILTNARVSLLRKRAEMRRVLENVHSDRPTFRITVPVKAPVWTHPWTPKEDSLLLVGVYRHGFNDWEAIRDDQVLGLSGCMTLAKGSLPQGPHLTRRIEYLIGLLAKSKKDGNKKSTVKKSERKKSELTRKTEPSKIKAKERIKWNNEWKKEEKGKRQSEDKTVPIDWKRLKPLLRPIRSRLEFIDSLQAEDINASAVLDAINIIGTHLQTLPPDVNAWSAVASMWPTDISGSELQDLFNKISIQR